MTTNEQQRVRSRRSVLKMGLGVAVGSGMFGLVSQRAAAHFPDELAIDIKPGSDRNPIAMGCHGVVPVAVLRTTFEVDGSTTVFDPTDRAVRYRFGAPATVENGDGARPIHGGHAEDREALRASSREAQPGDCEGHKVLVLHFPIEQTGFSKDSSVGKLLWERAENGEHGYAGTDQVTVLD